MRRVATSWKVIEGVLKENAHSAYEALRPPARAADIRKLEGLIGRKVPGALLTSLLALLMAEPGRTFSRAELLERVIGARVTERTVDVHVKELRRKLGPLGSQIEAIRGSGYRYLAAG
jgi:DNA-binding response OmpR family regulator